MAKNRPLKAVQRRLGPIRDIVAEIIAERGHADVLEVGCGLGLPMLELRRTFGDKLRITGINRDAKFNDPQRALWEGVKKRSLWPWESLSFEKKFGFPEYVNCDAGAGLPFEDDSFDLIYSIATTFFIPDKLNFLVEVNRVLRRDATARIHFSYWVGEACTIEQMPDPPQDNLCEILDRSGYALDVKSFLQINPTLRFIRSATSGREFLVMKKAVRLDFKVKLLQSYFLDSKDPNWIPYVRSQYKLESNES